MLIVKTYDVVVNKSERVPITFIWYVPAGFKIETVIEPVEESILIRSFTKSSVCPSTTLTPVYVHVLGNEPHKTVAENGVIAKF